MSAPERITEDEWQRRATASAIDAARSVIAESINMRASIGSLGEVEWGWIVASAIFGWIKVRAEQATVEGISPELTIRAISVRQPEPWEAGALETILPQLGGIEGVDWSKPVSEWSKDQIVGFAWQVFKLSDQALARRDEGALSAGIVSFNRERAEREVSAANKGPLLARNEPSLLIAG